VAQFPKAVTIPTMPSLAELDRRYIWHPFTQMRDWMRTEPIVIVDGNGAVLRDTKGRQYLDANASIWTNLHGHNHSQMNAAITRQLWKIAHSSALGLANEPASLLAEKLVQAANQKGPAGRGRLEKVFFSDDGSTAMEVALKLAYEFSRRTGRSRQPRFLSLDNAYHGDTVGAASLGQIPLFRKSYAGLMFKTDKVPAPYCYRCRFNRAKPERADAREYRKCSWECVQLLERKFEKQKKGGNPYSGFVFEPLIQGAAGMIPQPAGWLGKATKLARHHGALLVADEVMTGFGRTGCGGGKKTSSSKSGAEQAGAKASPAGPLFACQSEGVGPDFLAVAKGLTGGYLPMAATLTTREVFDAFVGEHGEYKTFFHGHSYTANQLGAAAALQSMEILQSPESVNQRRSLESMLQGELQQLWEHPSVGDIRQVGLVAGIELVKDLRKRTPFDAGERVGIRVCDALSRRGVLTRSIGNVIVLMPPYCTTQAQLWHIRRALLESLHEILPVAPS
jgi:adenosylmethionine-8-amino-7-oxononanoate aminotransferase